MTARVARDIYVFNDWISLGCETWHLASEVVHFIADVRMPSPEQPTSIELRGVNP